MEKLNRVLWLCVVALLTACTNQAGIRDDYEKVSELFRKPTAEYTSAPLWVWNDVISREEIKSQLDDFHAKGIDQVFVHPRPGLVTEYLSPEWLDLFRYAVSVGKQNGMKVWIYDENSYPSGFAGGHVPAAMPESRGRMISMRSTDMCPAQFDKPLVALFTKDAAGYRDVTADTNSLKGKNGNFLLFQLVESQPNPWYAGYYYVDVMQKEVTEKFLDITLNAYKNVFGDEFGKTVPGSFQDECNLITVYEPSVMPFTPALFASFQTKWGYDLREKLPLIFFDTLDYKTVRHNYYSVLLDLFADNWAIPYRDYCEANQLQFTGHYWEHEWPRPLGSPDNMAMAAYAHIPGIDLLMNQWGNGPGGQFGVDRSVREVRSIANQTGQKRILSETYGAAGWDISFADQKRIVDWETVLGINLVDQHLQYMTIAGARKRDHPQSFSYHEPWWDNYKTMADYISRISVVTGSGEQMNRILVIEPTTTGWMHCAAGNTPRSQKMIDSMAITFNHFIRNLEMAQVEYDLGDEPVMSQMGRVDGASLKVGKRNYDLVVLPPMTENLNSATVKLLEDYLKYGGKMLSYRIPDYIDGKQDDAVQQLSETYASQWSRTLPEQVDIISAMCTQGITFTLPLKGQGVLYHQRRLLKDAQLLMLVNSSDSCWSLGSFETEGKSVEKWDAFTGERSYYEHDKKGNQVAASFNIPPKGSLILCIRDASSDFKPMQTKSGFEPVQPEGDMKVTRLSPNVLTIDYCDLTLGGKTEKDLYFYQANLKAYQYHGFVGDPWDNGVQFKSQVLDRDTLGKDAGFEATFWFQLAPGVDTAGLSVVVERPDLFTVAVNDKPVSAANGQWWLDKKFAVYRMGSRVKTGLNKITVKSSPFRVLSELESVYLLGNFSVTPAAKGFVLSPVKQLNFASWNTQGMPFYADKVGYTATYAIDKMDSSRYSVHLKNWRGTVAEVRVNDQKAGVFISEPYSVDVTKFLKKGSNTITVSVTGSLINTLGPHHNHQPLGSAWPGMFKQGNPKGYPPGKEYRFIDYGLNDRFELLREK